MRILIVGAGATGGYFGGHLAEAGRDVTFLVRAARAKALAENGLVIRNAGRPETRIQPKTTTAAELSEPVDVVLLSVKAYGLTQSLDDLAPAIGDDTVILPVLNGMRHMQILDDRLGRDRVLGGLCMIAAQLDADGAVHQMGPGATLAYGERDGSISDRITRVDEALSGVDAFTSVLSRTIERDMWEKWLMLASGGALTTLLRGTVGDIEASPSGSDTARAIVAECVAVITASGIELQTATIERITGTLTTPGSGFTTSMYRDLAAGNDVEAEQIVGDMVRRGQDRGVSVPLLAAAYAGLSVYQRSLPGLV
jgi:2-dehydropantoate 2-reductase